MNLSSIKSQHLLKLFTIRNKSSVKHQNESNEGKIEQTGISCDSVVERVNESIENENDVPMTSFASNAFNDCQNRNDETVELSDDRNVNGDDDLNGTSNENASDFADENSDDCAEDIDIDEDKENSDDSDDEDEEISSGSDEEIKVEGRRIMDVVSFFRKIQRVSRHNRGKCSFNELKIIKEVRIGFHSKFTLRCGKCSRKFHVRANDNERTAATLDINSLAVLATNLIGIGYSQLEQFCSVIDVPTMSYDKYKKLNDKMGKFWEETAEQCMREAAEEEARIAIERGNVDPIDGVPFVMVIVDECWSKRSYNRNFTALSGVGAIVGAETGKVLWIGVRNRYCVICVRAKNKDIEPRPHSCTCNYTGPSSEMEWETILEGFKSSVELYNLRYLKFISDGDSSTYAKLLEHKPYQDRHIEKIECTNHLFRNFRKNIEAAVKGCPRGLNKHVTDNLERIRKDIHCAVKFRKNGNTSEDEKISLLKSDLNNILSHVFGSHSNCPTYIKGFCTNQKSYVPALEQCNTFEKMSAVMRKMMYCAKDLLTGETNNPAEHFNSIVAKFVGGKRVNFSLSNAYRYRANAAVVQFNTQAALSKLYETKFKTNAPPLAKKIEVKRLRKSEQGKQRRKELKENKIIRTPFSRATPSGAGYGPGHAEPDMSPADFDNEKRIHLDKLERFYQNRISIEKDTHKKQKCNLWNEIVPKMLLSKDFGPICKARLLAGHVKEMSKQKFVQTKSSRHQTESLPVALLQLGVEINLCVQDCGLFIDNEHHFLAASPSGVVSDTDTIVEIQCPLAITTKDPNDLSVLGKLDFMAVTEGAAMLKRSHNMYYDIQGQLHICNKKVCIFAIWTSSSQKMYIERVERDDNFFATKIKNRLLSFYNDWLLPELLDPRLNRGMEIRMPDE